MSDRNALDLGPLAWPTSRLGEALEAAARHGGLPTPRESSTSWAPPPRLEGPALDRWVHAAGASRGVEIRSLRIAHAEVEATLLRAAPALVRLDDGALLVIAGKRGRTVTLATPDGIAVRQIAASKLRAALCSKLETPVAREIDGWLHDLIGNPRRRVRARDALVRERLRNARVADGYLLGAPAGSGFWTELGAERVVRSAVVLLTAHTAQLLLTLGSWYILGANALGTGIDRSWLWAWALCLISAIPFSVVAVLVQGRIVLAIGTSLKRRLLAGALKIDEHVIRREGPGQLLGRATESAAVEALALSGGSFALLALVELVVLAWVMASGPGGGWQAFAFVAWGVLTIALGVRTYCRAVVTAEWRRRLTDDLVEKMVGHRTRLAQLAPARWHDGEDEAIARYTSLAHAMDRAEAWVRSMPQAWLALGLATCVPSFLDATSPARLAVAVGGAVLGGATLTRLSTGLTQLVGAAVAWREVAPLYEAAARRDVEPSAVILEALVMKPPASDVSGSQATADGEPSANLLDATDLVFSYPSRPRPAVLHASLRIRSGDRILVEGPSGGGKSTFASLLSGLRRPDGGLLLVDGLDWQTLGSDGWRQRVATAPQYHDNHVLTGTFLFNLLMGRRWPPSAADVDEAREVCRALGFDPLLDRMPSGLLQIVGDSGWQLSHGERSRLFLARAMLQGAGVIVLDETFAALDAGTLDPCLRWVLSKAPALVVIAHP